MERANYLLLGCGLKGAEWMAQRTHRDINYLGVDITDPHVRRAQILTASTLYLPFREQSMDKIIGDFIVNGVIANKPAVEDIWRNPDMLDSHSFPEIAKTWFRQVMQNATPHTSNDNIHFAQLLKTATMQEMWRVLKISGEIEILDFGYNINWLFHYAPQILNQNPELMRLNTIPINSDDYNRSHSLNKVSRGSTPVGKLRLTKLPPRQSVFRFGSMNLK